MNELILLLFCNAAQTTARAEQNPKVGSAGLCGQLRQLVRIQWSPKTYRYFCEEQETHPDQPAGVVVHGHTNVASQNNYEQQQGKVPAGTGRALTPLLITGSFGCC